MAGHLRRETLSGRRVRHFLGMWTGIHHLRFRLYGRRGLVLLLLLVMVLLMVLMGPRWCMRRSMRLTMMRMTTRDWRAHWTVIITRRHTFIRIDSRIISPSTSARCLTNHLLLWTLEPLLAPQVTTVLKHISRIWVQSPVASLTRSVWSSGDFHKTVIKREAMTYGILPPLLVLSVERKQVHDELINLAECTHFILRLLYCHGDERYIGIWRFGVRVCPSVIFVSPWSIQCAISVHRHEVWVKRSVHTVHGRHSSHG